METLIFQDFIVHRQSFFHDMEIVDIWHGADSGLHINAGSRPQDAHKGQRGRQKKKPFQKKRQGPALFQALKHQLRQSGAQKRQQHTGQRGRTKAQGGQRLPDTHFPEKIIGVLWEGVAVFFLFNTICHGCFWLPFYTTQCVLFFPDFIIPFEGYSTDLHELRRGSTKKRLSAFSRHGLPPPIEKIRQPMQYPVTFLYLQSSTVTSFTFVPVAPVIISPSTALRAW